MAPAGLFLPAADLSVRGKSEPSYVGNRGRCGLRVSCQWVR